jgi:hypothetical protein
VVKSLAMARLVLLWASLCLVVKAGDAGAEPLATINPDPLSVEGHNAIVTSKIKPRPTADKDVDAALAALKAEGNGARRRSSLRYQLLGDGRKGSAKVAPAEGGEEE